MSKGLPDFDFSYKMDFLATFQDFEPGNSLELNVDYVEGVSNLPLDCTESIAPYVPASRLSILAAIQLASLQPFKQDVLCDLGCGNGKILTIAREVVGGQDLRLIGVELDEKLYEHVASNFPFVKAIQGNMFDVDLVELEVSVLILYLLPAGLAKLRLLLARWFADHADSSAMANKRIVTIGYQIAGWTPQKTVFAKQIDDLNQKAKEVFTGGSTSSDSTQPIYLYNLDSISEE